MILYHYGTLGECGAESVRTRGLLPFRKLYPDYYEDDEWTPDHDAVWAFTDPTRRAVALGADRVVFEVPDADADTSRGHGIAFVRRIVRPDEVIAVELSSC